MFHKAIVIGCPGAGKSTFARRLQAITGLPLHYLDMYWHNPDQTHRTRGDFDRKLQGVLAQKSWIIDGNYQRTLKPRLEACDAVFLFDLPPEVCLEGAASRIGKPREDLPWTETVFDPEFRQFILDFPKNELPQIYASLAAYQNRRDIQIFRSRQEAGAYLHALSLRIQA